MSGPFLVLCIVWLLALSASLRAVARLRSEAPDVWERLGRPKMLGGARSDLAFLRFVWSRSVWEMPLRSQRLLFLALRVLHVLLLLALVWVAIDLKHG